MKTHVYYVSKSEYNSLFNRWVLDDSIFFKINDDTLIRKINDSIFFKINDDTLIRKINYVLITCLVRTNIKNIYYIIEWKQK